LRLGPEPGEVRCVFLEMRMDDLERDLTVQLCITRAVHFAHPAGAKDGQHVIGTDPGAWSQCHDKGRDYSWPAPRPRIGPGHWCILRDDTSICESWVPRLSSWRRSSRGSRCPQPVS